MNVSLTHLYCIMLMAEWTLSHNISMGECAWHEDHVITIIDNKNRQYKFQFIIDADEGYIEMVDFTITAPPSGMDGWCDT